MPSIRSWQRVSRRLSSAADWASTSTYDMDAVVASALGMSKKELDRGRGDGSKKDFNGL